MDREFAGQPLWLWLAGGGVVILGYLYFRSHQSGGQQQGQDSGQGGTGKSSSTSSFKEWITQHQGPPGKGTSTGPGPEREWLIHKTGSQRPWTFLRRHHERVVVGPTGSRKIVRA